METRFRVFAVHAQAYCINPGRGVDRSFLAYCNLLVYRMKHTPQNCRQESIMQLLRVYFWDVYTVYINDPQAEKSLKFTRKDEYVYQFVRLIIEDHSPDKDVAYFAQKLGISPKGSQILSGVSVVNQRVNGLFIIPFLRSSHCYGSHPWTLSRLPPGLIFPIKRH